MYHEYYPATFTKLIEAVEKLPISDTELMALDLSTVSGFTKVQAAALCRLAKKRGSMPFGRK